MDVNLVNISKIETFFNGLIDGVVSDNTFFTELPSAINEDWEDMVVVDCANMVDMDAFGKGIVLIWLYVPPMVSGKKNVARMSLLETRLNECIESNVNETYKISRRDTYSGKDEQRNLFYNIVEITTMILT